MLSFVLKMLSLLYLNILLIFSFGECFAEEILSVSFTDKVTGSSGTTKCVFKLRFNDTEILTKSKVKCGRINRPMTIDSYTYELKSSMLILRNALKNCKCCFFQIVLSNSGFLFYQFQFLRLPF